MGCVIGAKLRGLVGYVVSGVGGWSVPSVLVWGHRWILFAPMPLLAGLLLLVRRVGLGSLVGLRPCAYPLVSAPRAASLA